MYKSTVLSVLVLKVFASTVLADGGLFSEVTAESVFSSIDEDYTGTPSTPKGSTLKLNTTGSLIETLLAAGYTSKKIDEETVAILLQTETLTKTVALTINENRLTLTMLLTKVKEDAITAPEMLALMKVNHTQQPASFAVNSEKQRLELSKSISNRRLSGSELRRQLEALALIAETTKSLWDIGTEVTEETTRVGTDLTGKWIASPTTTQAFALQLEAGNTFKLVNVNGTNNAKSTGTYTLEESKLVLKGEETTLTGKVEIKEDAFDFKLNDKLTLSFTAVR